jgi:hypothetical protein
MTKKPASRYTYPVANEGDVIEEFQCVSFFVPEGWWNRAALIGAYYLMGSRFMWPVSNYGEAVADKWREAYWLSREKDYMCTVENINNIYITNEGSDSGGCCDVNTNVEVYINASLPVDVEPNVDSPLPIDDVGDIPPFAGESGATTIQEYDELRCKIANWMADRIMADLNRMNSLLGIIKGDVAEGLAGRVAAFVALAASDGPYPFGDVAGLILLLSPKLFNWLVSAAYPGDLGSLGITVDREAMVAKFYGAETTAEWGEIFSEFMDPAITASGMSSELADYWRAYTRFMYGTRLANWYASNAKKLVTELIPDDYVSPTPCAASGSADMYFDFNDGTTMGFVYSTTPYPADNNPGILTTNAIEGTHSLQVDVLGSWNSSGGYSGGTWRKTLDDTYTIREGDKVEFLYEYVGAHTNYVQVRFRFNSVEQLQLNTPLVNGSQSAQLKSVIVGVGEGDFQCDQIWFRIIERGLGGGQQAGLFKIDAIGITLDDF